MQQLVQKLQVTQKLKVLTNSNVPIQTYIFSTPIQLKC